MCTFNHSCCSVLFEALLVEIKPSSLFEYDVGTPICGQFLTFFPTFTRQDRGHHYTAIFRSLQRCLIMFNFGL